MADPILETFPLASQWPTLDPFLFCAHHRDDYPAGDGRMAPAESLAGRQLGQDFAGQDGWNMYHGQVVPGFPQHPHRGFETVTFLRQGLCDHSDSLGATARFGRGDAQWVTAGQGIVHSEMFPLVRTDEPNPLHLFQIWLNLPAADKMVDPYFTMLWADDIPRHVATDDRGREAEITLVAGPLAGLEPPAPPPDSWAARADSDVAIWHIRLDPGATWALPPASGAATNRMLYVFEGSSLRVAEREVTRDTGVAVSADTEIELGAGPDSVEALMLQGRPIDEPVAQYGPFVMNDRAGIEAAIGDYQRTGFGDWPWPSDDPVHPADQGRFARHADGREVHVEATLSP